MKILIAVAHPQELKVIKSRIKDLNLIGFDFSFIQTGIGNYETIHNLTKLLEKESFDFIVNIGICGYREKNIGLFQVASIFNFSNKKEFLVPICFQFCQLDSIGCFEKQIKNSSDLGDMNFVDMESYGIEFIANKYHLPRIIIKLPSDIICDKLDLEIIKNSCLELSMIDYETLFSQIKLFLEFNLKKEDYDYIKEKYRFTFAEFEIIKLKIKKYEALSNASYRDFFEKNSSLDKKDYLELLDFTYLNFN